MRPAALNRRKLEERRTSGSSKNTRRWCGGKVGREHQTKCVKYNDVKRSNLANLPNSSSHYWRILVCTVCGKELANYWPFRERGFKDRPPPSWVDC